MYVNETGIHGKLRLRVTVCTASTHMLMDRDKGGHGNDDKTKPQQTIIYLSKHTPDKWCFYVLTIYVKGTDRFTSYPVYML